MRDFKIWEHLPSKETFYSFLTGIIIRNKGDKHALSLNVWKKLKMKTMKDYHGLYLKCDVSLLVDVLNLEIIP